MHREHKKQRIDDFMEPGRIRFVAALFKNMGDISAAARDVGIHFTTAHVWMKEPGVIKAIAKHRDSVMTQAKYDLTRAMEETDRGLAFALETGNANAYAKVLELRSKLNKLLVDQVDVSSNGFRINIMIPGVGENKVLPVPIQQEQIQPAEFKELPPADPFASLAASVPDPFEGL